MSVKKKERLVVENRGIIIVVDRISVIYMQNATPKPTFWGANGSLNPGSTQTLIRKTPYNEAIEIEIKTQLIK